MGEKQSRSVSPGCDQERVWPRRRRKFQSTWIRGLRLAVVVLCGVLAQPGQVPLSGLAWAQGPPAGADATPKAAAPRQAGPPETSQEPAPVTAEALSLRYRLIEKYSASEDPDHPELVTQYRVGIRETQKMEREKAQGAPDRSEISHQTIYTERVAQAGKLGEMQSAVRRYDRFAIKDAATARPIKPPLFEGLTILLRRQPGRPPKVLSLTPDRPLRQSEFSEITKQVIVPQLTALFPPTPKRVGDSWPIARSAAQSLVGEIPESEDYELTGTLTEVRKQAEGASLTAVIGVAGKMNLSMGLSSLRAQVQFTFDPPPAPASDPLAAPAASPRADDRSIGKSRDQRGAGIVDARGKITRVRMLWAVSDVLPEGDGRLKQTVTYELNLERRFAPAGAGAAGDLNALLVLPDPLPTADQANSWVVHDDPQGRFHFFHPQELILNSRMMDSDSVHLIDENPGTGKDVFIIQLAPGNDDPQGDRKFRDPQQFQREIDADWAKSKSEVLRGSSGWLPEAGWAPWKVYRKELGVKTAGADDGAAGVQRIFIDNYLVLSNRNECFRATSMTVRNDHVAFRSQAEAIIKSFRFTPWDGKPNAAAGAATAAPTPPP